MIKGSLSGLIVILCSGLSSCKTLHDPNENKEESVTALGGDIPIIQPGMTPEEVVALMGGGVIEAAPGLGDGRSVGIYRSIRVDYLNAKVLLCSSRRFDISEPNKSAPVPEEMLRKIMNAGMTRDEVESINGKPSFGFENKPGVITLVYPRNGIEVVYVKDRVQRWTKIYTFDR